MPEHLCTEQRTGTESKINFKLQHKVVTTGLSPPTSTTSQCYEAREHIILHNITYTWQTISNLQVLNAMYRKGYGNLNIKKQRKIHWMAFYREQS